MAAIKDVAERVNEAEVYTYLFGCTSEWYETFKAKALEVGLAIAEDNGINLENARSLPQETELGPKAEAAFRKLCLFLDKK